MTNKSAINRRSFTALCLGTVSLTGCSVTANSNSQGDTNAPTSATPTSSNSSAEDQAISKAKLLAASYDYDGALNALKGLSGDKVDATKKEIQEAQSKAVIWQKNDQISHLFFHTLVVDPARAFDHDSKDQGYRDYMVTIYEFNKIIEQLYAKGYVLVHPQDIATMVNGTMTYQEIKLPAGKTPLVISQDDVNYYEYMNGDGYAKNLTLKDGKVTNTYIDAQGKEQFGDYDMVPLLDKFVAAHPDFSYKGAKGTLALTGYNGVLGWRTSPLQYAGSKTLASDTQQAKDVAAAMKKTGWNFASHSWGHLDMGKITVANLTEDANKWDAEVRPIIGDTPLFIYPFGSDISGVPAYSGAKYEDLKSRGFNSFFNVDASVPAWEQLAAGYWRQARINIDGIRFAATLKGDPLLDQFFDTKSVIDPARNK